MAGENYRRNLGESRRNSADNNLIWIENGNSFNNKVPSRSNTEISFINPAFSVIDVNDSPISSIRFKRTSKPNNVTIAVQPRSQRNGSIPRPNDFSRRSSNVTTFYAASVGGQSRQSQLDSSSNQQQPSTPEEKAKTTRKFLAATTTISYTIFLIVFGFISFVGTAISTDVHYAEYYMIFLITTSFAYLIYLLIDVRRHISRMKGLAKEREKDCERRLSIYIERITAQDGPVELQNNPVNVEEDLQQKDPETEDTPEPSKPLQHRYCFMRGRHGEFLYLKLGAAWFCFGLLIHASLVITYEIFYLTSNDETLQNCGSGISLAFEILFPIFCVFTLIFIFKHINLIINTNPKLAKFMFMHLIGTSIAFWLYQIVCETKEALLLSDSKNNVSPRLYYMAPGCTGPEALNNIYQNFSPFLYPFIIEFCILSAGVWFMIYSHINKCPKKDVKTAEETKTQNCPVGSTAPSIDGISDSEDDQIEISRAPSEFSDLYDYTYDHETYVKTTLEVHADCHGSNKGLFTGLILVVVTICFIILFFIATSENDYFSFGLMLDYIFELVVLVVMIVAVIIGYTKTSTLDVNMVPMSKLDDALLFIAIPAFFAQAILSMIPAIMDGSVLNILNIITQVAQVLVQTPFIVDGMRRCSNSRALRKKKPGREFVTFLIFANVSLWVYYTFSVKTPTSGDLRYEFYGYTVWSILYHITLPLIMFYRFHSSVCLVDIWKHSYEPEGH